MEGSDQLGIEGQRGHKMTVSAAKIEVVGHWQQRKVEEIKVGGG